MLARRAPGVEDARVSRQVDIRDPYEPCVCGSGKKYRFCHQAELRSRQRAPRPEDDKLSRRLLEFAAPILPRQAKLEDYAHAVKVAAIVWNVAVLHEQGQDMSAVRRQLEAIGAWETSMQLVARKRAMFPGDHRQILESRVSPTNSGYHVQVVTMSPSQPRSACEAPSESAEP